eukprot:1639541-Prymnesium_polylepis.1
MQAKCRETMSLKAPPHHFKRQKADPPEELERLRKQSLLLEPTQSSYTTATNQLILILCGGIACSVFCGV